MKILLRDWLLLALFTVVASSPLAAQELLYSFEEDEEDWIATTLTGETDDSDAMLEVVAGIGNTDGNNSLQISGRTGGYVRYAQVDLDFERVELFNLAIEEGWNLEFDWTVVASENPGATEFWVQYAMNHAGGWSQADLMDDPSFDNGGWLEWDPAGPEIQTITASIPLSEFGNNVDVNNGYCCGVVPDGTSSTYQIQFAAEAEDEEGDVRTFYIDNFRLAEPRLTDPCDVDGNGTCDAADIDAMSQQVMDGTSTIADRTALIESPAPEGFNTYIGDSDLNGQFDEQDIVQMFVEGKYLTGEKAGWAEGDWDGDFLATDQDFVAAFVAGGYLVGPRGAVAAVPEPSACVLLALGLLGIVRRRK